MKQPESSLFLSPDSTIVLLQNTLKSSSLCVPKPNPLTASSLGWGVTCLLCHLHPWQVLLHRVSSPTPAIEFCRRLGARAELQPTEELAGEDMEFVVFEDPNLKEGKGFLSEESWPESQ